MMRNKTITLGIILHRMGPRIVACSGGLDSLLLATLAHRVDGPRTLVAHGESPAVPKEATERLHRSAREEGWNLRLLPTGEFNEETYLSNPYDRCYYCKGNLYSALTEFGYFKSENVFMKISEGAGGEWPKDCAILSGANLDDLREHRPGLQAAEEFGVRHPFIEAGMGKRDIRALARSLKLYYSDIAASPCLASRLYTGTRVTAEALLMIDEAETELKKRTGARVVRCRLNERRMLIEVTPEDRAKISDEIIDELKSRFLYKDGFLDSIALDPQPYRPGRAFIHREINTPTLVS